MYIRRLVDTEDALIVSLCADYRRRADALSKGILPHLTEMQYKYLNFKIYEAAAEIVGEGEAELYISEIGERRGYAFSQVEDVSDTTYKDRKKRVKVAIAKKLNLFF